MSDERKPFWPWIAALLIGLPVLYLLSSGPMQTVAFQRTETVHPRTKSVTTSWVKRGRWWPRVYAPLVWASSQPWGAPVTWYWKNFPIRVKRETPIAVSDG